MAFTYCYKSDKIMDLVEAKYQDEYSIKYIVYESKCPKCGALEEHHLKAEANFFLKNE